MTILEQIEDIAREAWEKAWKNGESGERESQEYDRLVTIVHCIADDLAIKICWHDDCFYFADSGSPIFPVRISGLNKAIEWLQQEQHRRDSAGLFGDA